MTIAGRNLVLALWTLHCAPAGGLEATEPAAAGQAVFHDVAADVGIDFTHANGMTGAFFFPEMTGPGCAFVDFDNDGDLDVYLVQGGPLAPEQRASGPLATDRLYRNDRSESEPLHFVDVTDRLGLQATGYGMGIATGDYDNDGWIDLYLTNYGANQLLRNVAGSGFEDTTREAGVDDEAWSTGATFFDFDRDGFLDLYVVNYVDFAVARNPTCYAPSSRRDYCGPAGFPAAADRLFRNQGDGTFVEVPIGGLPADRSGPGLGVVSLDDNDDGWLDLYVANDGKANFLWLNQTDGTFHDEALLADVALNQEGAAEASMGVDAADADGDGDEDLFSAHLEGETNTLYVNAGKGLFDDRTLEVSLGRPSLPFTSFGAVFLDYDLDGWLDLAVVSGAIKTIEAQRSVVTLPLEESNQLFRNTATAFVDVSEAAGPSFTAAGVSRGLAVGDVDNDGDPDLLLVHNGGRARLLLNRAGDERPWLGLRLTAGSLSLLRDGSNRFRKAVPDDREDLRTRRKRHLRVGRVEEVARRQLAAQSIRVAGRDVDRVESFGFRPQLGELRLVRAGAAAELEQRMTQDGILALCVQERLEAFSAACWDRKQATSWRSWRAVMRPDSRSRSAWRHQHRASRSRLFMKHPALA